MIKVDSAAALAPLNGVLVKEPPACLLLKGYLTYVEKLTLHRVVKFNDMVNQTKS